MIEHIINLLDKQFPEERFVPTPVEEQQVVFHVHFEKATLRITSVSASDQLLEGHAALAIEYDLGLKFMMGDENPVNWSIMLDDNYTLQKIDRSVAKISRVALGGGIYEVKENVWDDVRLVIDRENNHVDIHYDGLKIQHAAHPVKIYFTREADMSYLKCAFSLDVNILDTVLKENNLEEWPNPIRLKIADVDDMSVFAIKGPLTVCIFNG